MSNMIYWGESSNIIKLVRGDTYSTSISIESDTAEDGLYRLSVSDTLYFGIMYPHQKFEDAIIRKRFTKADQDSDGNILIQLEPSDTIDLDPGVYYYAVKLRQDNQVSTVINKAKFVILD